ncbi:hypothetical protein ACIQU6_34850 [Streptomyces sp. NPDC090442]|uniref:hypothetical protein n=1 Tax=Streptomyces sp. NPDC090442 TaxID=3365962 RepID=UPI003814122E
MRSLRGSYNQHVKELFPRGHDRLVSYVIRPAGSDASTVQSQLRELAEAHGRHVAYDRTDLATGDLAYREGFQDVAGLVYKGWADGLLVPDQATLTLNFEVYEQVVRWFGERNAYLFLLNPEGAE